MDTSTSTLKQVIEQERISELPLNGRNAAQLTLLVPGAVNSPNGGADQGATKTFPAAVTYSANGSRQNTISYQLDGGNYVDEYTNVNQPFPFPDALQEFSVQTSNYSAEYGENAGGVVNVITKSGTNNFHGDAFEFVRNPYFNAQNFFATPTTPDQVKRNQYGGTIGRAGHSRQDLLLRGISANGVSEPGVGQFEGGRTDRHQQLPGRRRNDRSRGGDDAGGRSNDGSIPWIGARNSAWPGPIPAGSNPDGAVLEAGHRKLRFGNRAAGSRLRPEGQNHRAVRVRPVHQSAGIRAACYMVAYTDATFSIVAQNALVHETHIFSPRLVNDFRMSYSREVSTRGPSPQAVNLTGLGVALPFEPTPNAIQGIGVQNGFNFGDNPSGIFTRNNFTYADDVSWENGKHDFHFGGIIEWSQVDLNNQFNQPGIVNFCTQDTYLKQAAGLPTYQNFLSATMCDGGPAGNGYAFQQGAGEFKANRNKFPGVVHSGQLPREPAADVESGLAVRAGAAVERHRESLGAGESDGDGGERDVSTVYPNAPPGILFSGQNGIPSDTGMPDNALNPVLERGHAATGFCVRRIWRRQDQRAGRRGNFLRFARDGDAEQPVCG